MPMQHPSWKMLAIEPSNGTMKVGLVESNVLVGEITPIEALSGAFAAFFRTVGM